MSKKQCCIPGCLSVCASCSPWCAEHAITQRAKADALIDKTDLGLKTAVGLADALVIRHGTGGDSIPAAAVADAIRYRDLQYALKPHRPKLVPKGGGGGHRAKGRRGKRG